MSGLFFIIFCRDKTCFACHDGILPHYSHLPEIRQAYINGEIRPRVVIAAISFDVAVRSRSE